jgi:hypothetical protein
METMNAYSTMTAKELRRIMVERNIKGRSLITKKNEMITVLIKTDQSGPFQDVKEVRKLLWENREDDLLMAVAKIANQEFLESQLPTSIEEDEDLDDEDYVPPEEEEDLDDEEFLEEISQEEYEKLIEEAELPLEYL